VLQQLEHLGMAVRRADGTWMGLARDLDDVAIELNALGRQHELRLRHAIDREQADRYLTRPNNVEVNRLTGEILARTSRRRAA